MLIFLFKHALLVDAVALLKTSEEGILSMIVYPVPVELSCNSFHQYLLEKEVAYRKNSKQKRTLHQCFIP